MKFQRQGFSSTRTFPLNELDGFYVDEGICVHITFEDKRTLAIDLYDDMRAAYNPERGKLVRSIILNLENGALAFEDER